MKEKEWKKMEGKEKAFDTLNVLDQNNGHAENNLQQERMNMQQM